MTFRGKRVRINRIFIVSDPNSVDAGAAPSESLPNYIKICKRRGCSYGLFTQIIYKYVKRDQSHGTRRHKLLKYLKNTYKIHSLVGPPVSQIHCQSPPRDQDIGCTWNLSELYLGPRDWRRAPQGMTLQGKRAHINRIFIDSGSNSVDMGAASSKSLPDYI